MAFRKIEAGLVHAEVDQFIGKQGTIFYDNGLGDFRISDGVTPGGIPLSFGGGGGGSYTLPTASTTTKGGVKVDGTTITIANQIISVGTVPYNSISGKPTIPTNTNQLTNGAGFITSSALSTYALSSSVPTDNNQLSNGAGYITSSALSGYATESYVTTRGYLTAVSWNDVSGKPTFATVATSGSYADLTNKPTIPTDINQLTDASGLLGQGGGGGTTYVTNNVENPFTFSVAADDSTLREISNGETLRFAGATGITIASDAEGKITIAGPDLTGYATQSYVTSQGYITNSVTTLSSLTTVGELNGLTINDTSGGIIFTISGAGRPGNGNIQTWKFWTNTNINGPGSYIEFPDGTLQTTAWTGTVSYNDLTDKPILFSGSYTDLTNKPTIPTNTNELTNGAGFITSSALTGLATESFVTSQGYITGLSWNQLTDKPNLAGTYSWNISADDSTQRQVNSDNLIKFIGGTGISTSSDADGNITITATSSITDRLTSGSNLAILNANGTFSLPMLTADPAGKATGQIALANGTTWDPLFKNESKPYLTLYSGTSWIEIGGPTTSQVYQQILEIV